MISSIFSEWICVIVRMSWGKDSMTHSKGLPFLFFIFFYLLIWCNTITGRRSHWKPIKHLHVRVDSQVFLYIFFFFYVKKIVFAPYFIKFLYWEVFHSTSSSFICFLMRWPNYYPIIRSSNVYLFCLGPYWPCRL